MMREPVDVNDPAAIEARIREQVEGGRVLVGRHARLEMKREEPPITASELREGLLSGRVLENYPDDRRGPSALLLGFAAAGRPIHVVCTTSKPQLFVITTYEPRPPKFVTPTQRGPQL